jgi:hypothetical protein
MSQHQQERLDRRSGTLVTCADMTADGPPEAGDRYAHRPRRLFRIAALLGVAFPMLAGCQRGIDVSALNQCGQAVEARVDEVKDFTVGWTTLGSEGRVHLGTADDDTTELYAQVRASENQTPIQFTVAVADLPKPPAGVDDDVEIVLTGDRCPGAAS